IREVEDEAESSTASRFLCASRDCRWCTAPQPAPDASAQLGGPLEAALKSRGISVENLVVTGTDEGVEVSITTSAGGEPTALRTRTVIEKELAYLKSDGQTAAE